MTIAGEGERGVMGVTAVNQSECIVTSGASQNDYVT